MKKKTEKPKVTVAKFLRDAVDARLDDADGEKAFPTLHEALCPVWDGRTLTRQGGKLTIRVDGAHYAITLDLPTEQLQARVSAISLVGLLERLEAVLSDPTLVYSPGWKKDRNNLPTIDKLIQ